MYIELHNAELMYGCQVLCTRMFSATSREGLLTDLTNAVPCNSINFQQNANRRKTIRIYQVEVAVHQLNDRRS